MVELHKVTYSPEESVRALGWNWMIVNDTLPYVSQEIVSVSEKEANDYFSAAYELYDMFVTAGQYIIDHKLYHKAGIPSNLIPLIEMSWEDDSQIHLYGRFDFAGGIDGQPIKLLEFNSDTATCLPETAVLQWAHLMNNGLEELKQFNQLFESLKEQFVTLANENPDQTRSLLVSGYRDCPEDDTNLSIIKEAAKEAGFDTQFAYIDEVDFSEDEGIFYKNQSTYTRFDFWFKLVPWEMIAEEEPGLIYVLGEIMKKKKAVILNPAYTLLFQSKYILKVLWDLFPNHPILLETTDFKLMDKKYVSKVIFGREGANTAIHEKYGNIVAQTDGDYKNQDKIYQEFVELPHDVQGQYYQAGVFYAGEPCGLGFRKGGLIMNNSAQFVGHFVQEG